MFLGGWPALPGRTTEEETIRALTLLRFTAQLICWQYNPRTSKPILNYASAHSKLVKRSIATTCLGSALLKSCHHLAATSFSQKVNRLEKAGFPKFVVVSVCEELVNKIKEGNHPSSSSKREESSHSFLMYIRWGMG